MTVFATCSSTTGPLPGFTVAQVAWRIGVSPAVYGELEGGTRSPPIDVWDRICKTFGWPLTFVGSAPAKAGRDLGRPG